MLNEKSAYFHIEMCLGRDLFSLAARRELLFNELIEAELPFAVWNAICQFIVGGESSEEILDVMAEEAYLEVLVHKVLGLQKPKHWNKLAFEQARALSDDAIRNLFWRRIRTLDIPMEDAVMSLAHIGIYGFRIHQLFRARTESRISGE